MKENMEEKMEKAKMRPYNPEETRFFTRITIGMIKEKELMDKINSKGTLLYRYIRGSHAYGLQKPDGTSDIDVGGLYIANKDILFGLPNLMDEQITDERNDKTFYEIGKFMQMLLKSNPTVLESLFVDDKFVIYEHPVISELKKHGNEFVTKDCFKSFIGYAESQIKKARGLNKKIVSPVKKKLSPLDFCYTFNDKGSESLNDFFKKHNLNQKYCGLVNIPNMKDVYALYYNWFDYLKDNNIGLEDLIAERNKSLLNFLNDRYDVFDKSITDKNVILSYIKKWFVDNVQALENKPFRGVINADSDSNDIRLSSIPKNVKKLCYMQYNKDGYSQHLKKYYEYKRWEKFRNPERFKENKDKEFDRKNIAHCVRLLHMGIEIAKTGEVHVNRENIDRDFILNIRLGNTSYDEIMDYLNKKKVEMEEAISKSTLPEHINETMVNDILIKIRNQFYG